jgi:hypothetical protein
MAIIMIMIDFFLNNSLILAIIPLKQPIDIELP